MLFLVYLSLNFPVGGPFCNIFFLRNGSSFIVDVIQNTICLFKFEFWVQFELKQANQICETLSCFLGFQQKGEKKLKPLFESSTYIYQPIFLAIAKKPMCSLTAKSYFPSYLVKKQTFKLIEFGYAVCAALKIVTSSRYIFPSILHCKLPQVKKTSLKKCIFK